MTAGSIRDQDVESVGRLRTDPSSTTQLARHYTVVPVFNEASYIARFISELQSALKSTPTVNRVVFVDDGSTDDTAAIVEQHCDGGPFVLLRQPANTGKGGQCGQVWTMQSSTGIQQQSRSLRR